MKKLVFIFAIALVAVIFNSCNKPDDAVVDKQYVKAFDGQFIAADGNLSLKSTVDPLVTKRKWYMYARNSVHYGNLPFALVKGNEFITGSPANLWWAVPGNNPVEFNEPTGVYSNLTPDEDLRVVCESKIGSQIAYLAMLDFNPDQSNFPLTINGYRLGDKLTINTDALTSLPGGNIIKVEVAYKLKAIDLAATEFGPVSKIGGIPNGLEFCWNDIVYNPTMEDVSKVVPAGSGNYVLIDGYDKKVFGKIVITITFGGGLSTSSNSITKEVDAKGPGEGLALKLTTNKVGWYDSQIIQLNDNDINVVQETLEIN